MTARCASVLLLFAALLVAGCTTGLTTGYWLPAFSNTTQSGAGSNMVDIQQDLGIDTGNVFAYEIQGESGKQRLRAGYWQLKGSGSAIVGAGGFNFAHHTYNPGDQTQSTLDMKIVTALWEPGLVMTPRFRLGLAIGANLLSFDLVADDITNPPMPPDGEVHAPGLGSGLENFGFLPVPVAGLGIEARLKLWLALYIRGEMFDTQLVPLIPDVDALFYGGEGGLLIGRPDKHFVAFAGYRYCHAEYAYSTDTGDSTLNGLVAGLRLLF